MIRQTMAPIKYCLILLIGLLPHSGHTTPDADRRVALVIGVSHYDNVVSLANPVNDARAIGESLRHLHFEVSELYDGNLADLTAAVREFGNRAANAGAAVVYYAGHGIQIAGENYLVPKDAKLGQEADLHYETMKLEDLLKEVARASRVGILLLDSCSDNPFSERMQQSSALAARTLSKTQGLARVDNVPHNTLVIMAAAANHKAEDGQEHSPFANALLAHFQVPGLELSLFYRSVRDTVLRATANRQEPYSFSSLGAEPFYFFPRLPNRPPEIGKIKPLEVAEGSEPMPLGLPGPTDPDQDPLTIRIVGVPQFGEVRVDGRALAVNTVLPSDRMKKAVFQPDGKSRGPVGSLDILIEDGRGGSVAASLPITVLPAKAQAGVVDKPAQMQMSGKDSDRPVSLPRNPAIQPVSNVALSQLPIWNFEQQQAAVVSSWLPRQRLDVEAWVDRGDRTYRLGEPVTVSVRPRVDSYITVLNYGTSGRMTVVFPNQFQRDNRVRAGQIVEVPPTGAVFNLSASGPAGVELLQVIASDRPLALPEVARIGMQENTIPFVSFGRSAEEVAHDLVLQLDAQSGKNIAVSKILTVQVLPVAAGVIDQTGSSLPLVGLPPVHGPAVPMTSGGAFLSVQTDKNLYRTGEAVQIMVRAYQPCVLTLVGRRSSGSVSQLYPNPVQPAITLMPGQGLIVPPPGAPLRLVAGATAGIETVVGLCSQADTTNEPSFQQVFAQQNALEVPRDLALVAAQPGTVVGQAATAYFVTQ